MRYYLLKNRRISKCCVKQPLFMKKYAYNKLSFSDNMDYCIVQSEAKIQEAKELTLKEAQELTNKWYTNREYETYLKTSDGDFIKEDGVYLKTIDLHSSLKFPIPNFSIAVAPYNSFAFSISFSIGNP